MKKKRTKTHHHSALDNVYFGGVVMVAVGLLLLMQDMIPGMYLGQFAPFLLIGLGLFILWQHYQQ